MTARPKIEAAIELAPEIASTEVSPPLPELDTLELRPDTEGTEGEPRPVLEGAMEIKPQITGTEEGV